VIGERPIEANQVADSEAVTNSNRQRRPPVRTSAPYYQPHSDSVPHYLLLLNRLLMALLTLIVLETEKERSGLTVVAEY